MTVGTIGKQTAPEYLGAVRQWDGFRLIVAPSRLGNGFYYGLQALLPVCRAKEPQWVPIERSGSPTLSKLLEKLAASTGGLSHAAQGLPDDPATAFSALCAARQAQFEELRLP